MCRNLKLTGFVSKNHCGCVFSHLLKHRHYVTGMFVPLEFHTRTGFGLEKEGDLTQFMGLLYLGINTDHANVYTFCHTCIK